MGYLPHLDRRLWSMGNGERTAMNRRAFLAALAGATLDPERLLWVPGKKLISIPPARVKFNVEFPFAFRVGDIIQFAVDGSQLWRVTVVDYGHGTLHIARTRR